MANPLEILDLTGGFPPADEFYLSPYPWELITFGITASGVPIVSGFAPSVGSTIPGTQVVSFQVTDPSALKFVALLVYVSYPSGQRDLVYDGTAFSSSYGGSTVSGILNGYQFGIVPVAGWPGSPSFHIVAVDTGAATNVPTPYNFTLLSVAPTPPQQPSGGGSPGFTQLSAPQLYGFITSLFPRSWWPAGLTATPPSGYAYALLVAMANNLGIVGDIVENLNPNGTWSVTFPDGSTQTYQLGSLLQQMLRLQTMSGYVLDIAGANFYGQNLPRLTNESDASYLNRILAGLFAEKVTRPAIFAMLKALTGVNPRMIDFWRPSDVGGLTKTTGAIFSSGGKSLYNLAANMPATYLGVDVAGAPNRLSNPGGGSVVTGTPPNQVRVNPGYAYQALIDTTWPLGFGAQGNPAAGLMTVTGSYPPTEFGGTLVLGSPSVYSNLSGGGLCKTGVISLVGGKSIYSVTAGNPAAAVFNPAGLEPSALSAAQATILQAIAAAKALGIAVWARCVPAAALAAAGWSS